MKKFLFGIHCHQPVDNFHNVVEEAIEKSYAPFFAVAKNFENFKFSLHVSGWLLNFWKQKAPEMFANLKIMAQRGQVEFFTGGYYEPILASIPSGDRKAQIKKLSKFLYKEFGQKPKGLWLTERVWESGIVKDIAKCGVKYVVIDDYHFFASGVSDTSGYYNTEDSGIELGLFPIQKNLRYQMPFSKPNDVIDAIKNSSGAAIMFDDGEKFGLWPKTYEWVYEQKWLEQFLTLCQNEIEFVHFEEYFNSNKPLGIIYPPSCSYHEMGEWSLNTDDALTLCKINESIKNIASEELLARSVRGGIWKNFLVKYPEAGYIHKRMLGMSAIAKKIDNKNFHEALYKLQTNDCLWHGVFGGLYLPNLRDNAYKYLLECEEIAYNNEPSATICDLNMDGYAEAKMQDEKSVIVFSADYGGALVEYGLKTLKYNFLATLARRKEAYHEKLVCCNEDGNCDEVTTIHKDSIVVSEDVLNKLVFDKFPRYSFVDFFSAAEMVEANIAKPSMEIIEWQSSRAMSIDGAYINDRANVSKKFWLENGILYFEFNITNASVQHYTCMLNFHLPDYKQCDFNGRELKEREFLIGVRGLSIIDRVFGTNIIVELNMASNLIVYPIDTASQSEKGMDLTNQAICCLFGLPIYNGSLTFSGSLRID